jgi:serine/threonine protein kinase
VCLLRRAVAGEEESDSLEPSFEDALQVPAKESSGTRFEHYQLLQGPDGQPLELGHGAMGVTYQAVDLSLRRPVALKVISQRCLGDKAAQRRFVREARAAGRVRHPNVASVYHLGQRGGQYFYAMEWVAGETLEVWLKREGPLEVKLALDIVGQVAAGLGGLHQQGLVHRDVKPSNIMLSRGDGGAVSAKLIDLGLAKAVQEAGSQTTLSLPGVFVGTPAYASPEQFAGMPVDIRSDLYSLGVTLWQMLTGQPPFQGSPADVMHKHLHAPLALEGLGTVPQPAVSLLEALLDKDPARRFQTPSELLQALPTAMAAIEAGRTLTRRGLRKGLVADPPSRSRKPPVLRGPKRISIARLPVTGSNLFGRQEDIAFLNDTWQNPRLNVVSIVAWAGVGKSTLVNHWLRRLATDGYRGAELVFGWSFYRQGSSGETSSADEFLDAALAWFGDPDPRIGTAWEKGERLAKLVAQRRTLLVLDGLEPLQNPPGPQEGRLREPSLQALLRELAAFNTGLCVITTRTPVADLADHERTSAPRRDLEQLPTDAGTQLLRALGVKGPEAELRSASEEFHGHCLALTLLGSYLTDAYNGDIRCRKEVGARLAQDVRQGVHARKVMESYQTWLGEGPELSVLRILGLFDRPADEKAIGALLKSPAIPGLTESLTDFSATEWRIILAKLRRARLVAGEDPHNPGDLDTHPLVREYLGEQLRSQRTEAWKKCNMRLYDHYRTVAPQLPDSFREMEPLFLAVTYGCNAGLYREALHEIYIPRIAYLERKEHRLEEVGLTLRVAKKLLGAIQQKMVEQQVEEYLETQRGCPHCAKARRLKGSHTVTFQTLFGNLELRSPRWNHCECRAHQATTFSPLLGLLNERVSPERLYLETKWASLISFELAADLLKDTLPIAETVNAAGVRNHLHRVAERAEAALGDEKVSFIEGCPWQWAALPRPEPPRTVGIDGCYVRQWEDKKAHFEVIVGKSLSEDRPSRCFGFVQTYDEKPKRRLFELLKGQGMQMNQCVMFFSDGGTDIREVRKSSSHWKA